MEWPEPRIDAWALAVVIVGFGFLEVPDTITVHQLGFAIVFWVAGAFIFICGFPAVQKKLRVIRGELFASYKQKEIAKLKSQLRKSPLNLGIDVLHVFVADTANVPTLRDLGEGGVVLIVKSLSLTNHSPVDKVSLDLSLQIRLADGIKESDYLDVEEVKEVHRGAPLGDYLCSPINIGTKETKVGDAYFLIWPHEMKARGPHGILHCSACRLSAEDRFSRKRVTKYINQGSWELKDYRK